MVSFSFGKKRRSRDTNRPGYSKKNYLKGTGRFRHPHTRASRSRPSPAYVHGDLDFGRRHRRRSRRRMPCIGRRHRRRMPCIGRRRSRRRMPCAGRRRRRSSMYFGKKRKSVRSRAKKGCGVYRKKGLCITTNGCSWVKKSRKCVKRRAKVARVSKSAPMGDSDDDLGAYASEAGIEFFGRRRKSRKMRRRGRSTRKSLRRRKSRKVRKVRRSRKVRKSRLKASFGRRRPFKFRKSKKSHKTRKLPAKIRKMCKRFKIKCTKKVGSRRVYKKLSVVKRQIARRMRSMRKRASRSRR